ncbi:hypothetical protein SCHPADRAFT_1001296 [Schizopora paradoxa]|uniref:Uncharacterized protein n=1 Tax=Schizopora paradoxa TaxID=27342 RepID=A0A0H2R805_9AGAM|nr:hypothetical protein SCHPADRAFT_1001296 [Schizopora paradoxa]
MPRGGTGEPPITDPLEYQLPGNDGIVVHTRWDAAEKAHFFDCHLCGMHIKLSKYGDNTNLIRHWDSRFNGQCYKARRRNEKEKKEAAAKAAYAQQNVHGQFPAGSHEDQQPSPSISSFPDVDHFGGAQFPPESQSPISQSPISTAPASSARAYYHPEANISNSSMSDSGHGEGISRSSSRSSLRVPSTSSSAAARIYHPYHVSGDPGPQTVLHHRLSRAARLSTSSLASHASSANSFDMSDDPVNATDDGCPGVWVDWTPGSIWTTYPFQRHEHESLKWELIGYDKETTPHRLLLRSVDCVMEDGGSGGYTCSTCQKIPYSSSFNSFRSRATTAKENTSWRFLNAVQQRVLLESYQSEARRLRTAVKNLSRTVVAQARRLDDYQRIVMLLSQKDVGGLRRILSVALTRGVSPQKLLSLLERAISGAYKVRGAYSQRDLDVSFLVRAIGGPRLLFALNKSHGLLSIRTINRNFKVPHLVPSQAVPTVKEIHDNIKSFLAEEVKKPPPIPELGNTLMFDGIALETKCRYCHTRNVIIGVCREHASRVNLSVDDWESVENVRKALFQEMLPEGERDDKKRICFGKEATVVAVGSLGRSDHYVPVPIVVSPSCKSERGKELAEWIRVVILAWKTHPMGESSHGPIWSLASDGDSAFRLARSLICTEQEFDPESRTHAGRILNSLPGLNRQTSKDGIVGSCDPKHIEKRFATLLRNESGIMVGDQHINAEIVMNHLCALKDMTREKARELLNPVDKQNVPKAVQLIEALVNLSDAPKPEVPGIQKERNTLIFLGKFLNSFVSPFTTATFSLSDQVRNLVTYAHVALALYMRHQTGCMTGALYADSQAAIKSIIFTIARMQEVEAQILEDPLRAANFDPIQFFLGHEGTDRLEVLFGEARTQDHARNFDILQLCQKLASSVLISSTFERNPDIDPGHKRLNLKNMQGVDHTNPFSWKGNTEVRQVNLPMCWKAGQEAASELLFKWDGTIVDFDAWFLQDDHDLCRPFGKYVGVNLGKDDLRTESEHEFIDPSLDAPTPDVEMLEIQKGDRDSSGDSSSEAESDASHPFIPSEGIDPHAPYANPNFSGGDSEPQFDELPGLDVDDWLPDEIEILQDFNQDSPLVAESPLKKSKSKSTSSHTGTPFSKILIKDGRKYLKSSVVAALCSKWSKKLSVRPLRVRGWSLENFVKQEVPVFNDSILDDKELVKRGDVAAVLCRTSDNQLALAVMRISGFLDAKGLALSSISVRTLQAPESKIKVTGQILEIFPSGNGSWKWNGSYIRIKQETNSHTAITVKNSSIRDVKGSFVYPIGPEVVPFDKSLSADDVSMSTTWCFDSETLKSIMKLAWEQVSGQNVNHHKFTEEVFQNTKNLPLVDNPASFPYSNLEDHQCFVIENVPDWIWGSGKDKKRADDLLPCFLCGNMYKLKEMRAHVGGHIIKAFREVEDPSLKAGYTVAADPCGWCGQDPAISKCVTQLAKSKGKKDPKGAKGAGDAEPEDGADEEKHKLKLTSTCVYAYSRMSYNTSRIFSKSNPCTNVPIPCQMCPETQSGDPRTIWKFNAIFHIIAEHAEDEYAPVVVPTELLFGMHVQRREETALGVCEESTTQYRDRYDVPPSDDFEEMKPVDTTPTTIRVVSSAAISNDVIKAE